MFSGNDKILRNRNFILLLMGKFVSQVGNWIYYLAIVLFISRTTQSTMMTGIVMFCSIVPVLLFGTVAGSVSRRFHKRNILVVTDFISGVLSLYLGIRVYMGNWFIVEACIVTFALSTTKTFFSPALFSAVPMVVDKEELNKANSLIKSTNSITNILGPVIGASIIMFIGCPLAFVLNGISFIISAISEMFVKIKEDISEKESVKWHKFILSDAREGLNLIKGNKLIRGILIVFGIMTFFASPIILILQQLVDKYYNMNEVILSAILVADGVGVLIAGLYLITKPKIKHQKEFIYIFPMFCGVALVVMGVVINHYVAVIVMLVQGFVSGFGEISMMTIFQSEIPKEELGMVFSIYTMLLNSLAPISMLVFGIMLEWISVRTILVICGTALIIGAMALSYRFIFREKISEIKSEA